MRAIEDRQRVDLPNQMLIDGNWSAGSAGAFADLNPVTEEVLTHVASASAEDVDRAVASARAQLEGEWAAMPGAARGRILNRVADLIERDADRLAELEALDVGKPAGQPGCGDPMQRFSTRSPRGSSGPERRQQQSRRGRFPQLNTHRQAPSVPPSPQ
jgi:betaine-aldehyde dehydrogenase